MVARAKKTAYERYDEANRRQLAAIARAQARPGRWNRWRAEVAVRRANWAVGEIGRAAHEAALTKAEIERDVRSVVVDGPTVRRWRRGDG